MKLKYNLQKNYLDEKIAVKDVFFADRYSKQTVFPYRVMIALDRQTFDWLTEFCFYDLNRCTEYYLFEFNAQINDEDNYNIREPFYFFSDPTLNFDCQDERINEIINFLKDCKNKDKHIELSELIRLQFHFNQQYKQAISQQYIRANSNKVNSLY